MRQTVPKELQLLATAPHTHDITSVDEHRGSGVCGVRYLYSAHARLIGVSLMFVMFVYDVPSGTRLCVIRFRLLSCILRLVRQIPCLCLSCCRRKAKWREQAVMEFPAMMPLKVSDIAERKGKGWLGTWTRPRTIATFSACLCPTSSTHRLNRSPQRPTATIHLRSLPPTPTSTVLVSLTYRTISIAHTHYVCPYRPETI